MSATYCAYPWLHNNNTALRLYLSVAELLKVCHLSANWIRGTYLKYLSTFLLMRRIMMNYLPNTVTVWVSRCQDVSTADEWLELFRTVLSQFYCDGDEATVYLKKTQAQLRDRQTVRQTFTHIRELYFVQDWLWVHKWGSQLNAACEVFNEKMTLLMLRHV
jgi:hypothetical protein